MVWSTQRRCRARWRSSCPDLIGCGRSHFPMRGCFTHCRLTAPPNLQGQRALHAWTVPGVMGTSTLSTTFACTNTLSAPVVVGVQVFGPAGDSLNDPSATALTLAPGATAVFATVLTFFIDFDVNLVTIGPRS